VPHSWGAWPELIGIAERWLLPAECLGCQRPLTSGDEALACPLCRRRWRPMTPPWCPRCGQPVVAPASCRICPEWPRDFQPVRSALVMDPSLRRLLHQFKYHGWRRLAPAFAHPMLPLLAGMPAEAVLVPVPLGRRRQRQRGYNQAAELASALGRQAGVPVWPALLSRHRETGTQTRLGRAQRLANLAGAFRARATERPVVLVDDVFTTGATLVSAARALLDAGAPAVGAVTLARAEPPLAAEARRLFTTQ